MILKDLFELLDTSSTPVKVIGSGTGKVLIHNYRPTTHSAYNGMEVRGIFPELYMCGITCKDTARVRIVVLASDMEYKTLKEEDKK